MDPALSSILAQLQAGTPTRIAGLGDSLTYGWEVKRGFFDRFVDGIQQRFPECTVERLNAGIPGDTAAGGRHRASRVLRFQPHLVTVEFALNDCFMGVPLGDFKASLRDTARAIHEAGAVPLLCTSSPLQQAPEAALARPYYDAVAEVARESGAPLADLERYWREHAAVDSSQFTDDGVHPSDAGHAIMAEGLLALFPPGQ